MKAYSRDLRERVVAAAVAGKPKEEVAGIFGVSMSSVNRWLRLKRETGKLEPRPITGRPGILGKALDAGLAEQLRERPDATIAEHCELWGRRTGTTVSGATMSRAMGRAGWPLKKKDGGGHRAR